MRTRILSFLIGFGLCQAACSQGAGPVQVSGFLQHWTQVQEDVWDLRLQAVWVKFSALVDERIEVVVQPSLAQAGPSGAAFSLLDAYATWNLGDHWFATAGQFKFAFGDDRYLAPDQLQRVNYTKMSKFAFPGKLWDVGFEVMRASEDYSVQAAVIQGAGSNALTDNDVYKDFAGRAEWRTGGFTLGGSCYHGTSHVTGFTERQTWLGAHTRFRSEGFEARAEAIWAPMEKDAYFAQIAYRTGDWEPLVWGELGLVGSMQAYQSLGGGLNFWPAPQTRLSVNGILGGIDDLSDPILGIFQVEQVF